ncbi:unnamed protein product [Gadus morhua 'NCC']
MTEQSSRGQAACFRPRRPRGHQGSQEWPPLGPLHRVAPSRSSTQTVPLWVLYTEWPPLGPLHRVAPSRSSTQHQQRTLWSLSDPHGPSGPCRTPTDPHRPSGPCRTPPDPHRATRSSQKDDPLYQPSAIRWERRAALRLSVE